jgi:plasmid stabilization system protein ParE
MATIIWTVRAYEHLRLIGEYIKNDSPFQARRVVQLVIKETHRLKANIRIGQMIPEMREDVYRELKVFSYRIIYKIVDDERVVILSIVHARMILDRNQIE